MNISVSDIEKAVDIVEKNSNRLKDSNNKPGGLLDFSQDTKPTIVIGDLHGAVDNLKAIVNHSDNLERLKKNNLQIIILGDACHNDQTGQMREMESSLEILEEVIQLICTYGENVVYIRGNHDSFDENFAKSAIKQGLELRLHMAEHWGEEYVKAVNRFFESLPLAIIGNGFVVTHAGPIRNGCSRQELIDIKYNPDHYHQLLWNRLHEFRGTPSLKEYGEADIRKMLERLNLPPDTPFIIGHNPMWHTGNKTGIWRNILGIKNHIIIYSNLQTNGPYLLIEDGQIQEKYAVPEAPVKFYV